MTKIIGITGPIASGKSETSKYLAKLGYKIYEADKQVSFLWEKPEIIAKIKEGFSEYCQNFSDNITAMKEQVREVVFRDKDALDKIESILHPYIEKEVEAFIQNYQNEEVIFLDIPLLFEKKYDKYCDKVILIYADLAILEERILKRPSMTKDLFNKILDSQMPLNKKQLRADYLIYNNFTHAMLTANIDEILKNIGIK